MSIKFKIFDLQCFIALCTYKNFTKAAQKMCISQPPFSRIIQKLELEMRGELIDRSTRSFNLSFLGKYFLEEAQKVVGLYENSMSRMESLRHPKSEDLKIGFTGLASHMAGFYELIDNLSHQASEIYLEELSSENLYEKLQNHDVDIGIIHFQSYQKSLQVSQIKSCRAAVLFPQQICCFREKLSYQLILNDNKIDKLYNKHLLSSFSDYNLIPLYKRPTQLGPQLALQGQGVLICPEPTAKVINASNIFTLEEINKSEELFGLYIMTQKIPFKSLAENIIKNYN